VHRAAGVFDDQEREQLLADRPTEERSRPSWSVVWALPRDRTTSLPGLCRRLRLRRRRCRCLR
jgi:hypothetical protein